MKDEADGLKLKRRRRRSFFFVVVFFDYGFTTSACIGCVTEHFFVFFNYVECRERRDVDDVVVWVGS